MTTELKVFYNTPTMPLVLDQLFNFSGSFLHLENGIWNLKVYEVKWELKCEKPWHIKKNLYFSSFSVISLHICLFFFKLLMVTVKHIQNKNTINHLASAVTNWCRLVSFYIHSPLDYLEVNSDIPFHPKNFIMYL